MARVVVIFFFFFKQKTAYELRISDWSSDVCSSDLARAGDDPGKCRQSEERDAGGGGVAPDRQAGGAARDGRSARSRTSGRGRDRGRPAAGDRKSTRLNSSH